MHSSSELGRSAARVAEGSSNRSSPPRCPPVLVIRAARRDRELQRFSVRLHFSPKSHCSRSLSGIAVYRPEQPTSHQRRLRVQVERARCSHDFVLHDGVATAHDLELRSNGRRKFCSLLADSHLPWSAPARLCGFWLTQLGSLGKTGSSHFRALPEGVRRAGRRYRAGASVTSLATYRTNATRPVSSSQ